MTLAFPKFHFLCRKWEYIFENNVKSEKIYRTIIDLQIECLFFSIAMGLAALTQRPENQT
jgi:hypothetical protein